MDKAKEELKDTICGSCDFTAKNVVFVKCPWCGDLINGGSVVPPSDDDILKNHMIYARKLLMSRSQLKRAAIQVINAEGDANSLLKLDDAIQNDEERFGGDEG